MYETDGDFGKVRLAVRTRYPYYEKCFNCITICGWHCCNDKYKINRLAKDNDTNLILYTISGSGELLMNGNHYCLLPGTAIIIKEGTAVSYFTPKNGLWEFYWIHFTAEPSKEQIDLISKQSKQLVTFRSENIRVIIEYALADKSGDSICSIIQISSMLSQVIHEFMAYQDIENIEMEKYGTITRKVISFIQNNYDKDIGTKDISNDLYISCEHLIRIFKKEMGITPYAYLCNFRIEKAKEFLTSTNISVEKIAHMVGFNSHSNFSKQFKTITGISPIKFRLNQSKS